MRLYCSLTDRKYLPRLLAMYYSLQKHSSAPFRLMVLALDGDTQHVLDALDLPGVLATQWKWGPRHRDHSWQEYCWLMASQFVEVVIQNEDEVTYLDADLFFFGDPETVHREIKDKSIAIVPHRFIPEKRHLAVNGKFNVSWVTFRGEAGFRCASRWAHQCREWCYARVEDGKFGDQKYLDAWPALFPDDLHIISNVGAGLAPWNLANYQVDAGPTVDGIPVCFYHFHEFVETAGRYRLTNYRLRPEDEALIYRPYIAAFEAVRKELEHAADALVGRML